MTKCPQCGYEEKPTVKNQHSVMHHFVTEDGKREAAMNRSEERFDGIVGEGEKKVVTKWVRKDIFEKEAAAKAQAPKK